MALAQYGETYWFPTGTLAANIPARVFEYSTNTLASLYADAAGTTPLANPLDTTAAGRLEFWAEEGRYWVHIDSEAFAIAVGAAAQPATQADLATKMDGAGTVTANAIARFSGTTGLVLKDSTVTIADDGTVTITGDLDVDGAVDLNGHVHIHDILVGIGAATTDDKFAVRLAGDAARRLRIRAGGTVQWGNGTDAPDTNLYRQGAHILRTDDALQVGGALDVTGAASLAGGVTGDTTVTGDLTISGTGKAYRLRRGGSALDLEATGVDLLISNWSGTAFDGTQRSYLRLSADAQNVQAAGKIEFVDALYGATRHVIDGAANQLGFHGSAPVSQQTVTGSRGGNAALASLLTALDALGIVVDSSTA